MDDRIAERLPDTEDALVQLHDESVLKLSLLKTLDMEIEHVQNSLNTIQTNEAYSRFQQNNGGKLLQMICRKIQSGRRWHSVQNTAPRILKIAAVLIAVMAISMVTAIAAVPAVRAGVLSLLMDVQERYTEFKLIEKQDIAFWVPEDWDGDYFPAYIPQQFTLVELQVLGDSITAVFTNEGNQRLEFSEIGEGTAIQVDTENAETEYSYIHGSLSFVSTKNNHSAVVWRYSDTYFYLYYEGNRSEAVKIAESVVHIR